MLLARHRHTRGVNDVGLDAARLEPARQQETIMAGLESILRPAFSASSIMGFEDEVDGDGWRSDVGLLFISGQNGQHGLFNRDSAFGPREFHAAAAPVRILFTILISKGSCTNSPPVCSKRLKWGVAIC